MKITLCAIGKTDADYLKSGLEIYISRLKHYIKFETKIIPDLKNTKNISQEVQKQKEGQLILKELDPYDIVILLDENGKEFKSTDFAKFIEKKMVEGAKGIAFIIGGPYGFSEEVYQRANLKIALSKMTFSHQMVRLIFVEQLYRAFTIIKGEPYHHN